MKRLLRNRAQGMVGGVAAGMADYFEVDVTLVRLLWVLAMFTSIGFLGYIAAWLIIPEGVTPPPPRAGDESVSGSGAQTGAEDGSEPTTAATAAEATTAQPGSGTAAATARPPLGLKPIGWLLLILGSYMVLARLSPWHSLLLDNRLLAPLILAGIGLLIVLNRR